MKKIILIVQLLCFAVSVFSQNSKLADKFAQFGTPITGMNYVNRSIVYKLINDLDRVNRNKTPEELEAEVLANIVGTPFMNNEFQKGEVLTVDSAVASDVLLRFNVYNDMMELKQNNILYELANEKVRRVTINDKEFEYLPYMIGKDEHSGYLELISNGDLKLYCRYAKKFKDAQPQKAMEDRPSPAEFTDLSLVYLLKGKDDISATGFRNKKELLSILPGHKKEIENYIIDQKIKFRDEADLKKLVSYYNSL